VFKTKISSENWKSTNSFFSNLFKDPDIAETLSTNHYKYVDIDEITTSSWYSNQSLNVGWINTAVKLSSQL